MGMSGARSELRFDNDDIDELYRTYSKQLFVYAKSSKFCEYQAEVLIQETFVTACDKQEKLVGHPNPGGWLMMTLKNKIKEARRENAAFRELVKTLVELPRSKVVYDPQQSIGMTKLHYEMLLVRSQLLTEDEFSMLLKIAFGDYTLEELAKEYGIKVDTCKKQIYRARKKAQKIRHRLQDG